MAKGGTRKSDLGNIYSSIPAPLKEELLEILLAAKGIRIERIVSQGHATPEGQWYDQDTAEWVILLKGSAAILFEGDQAPTEMTSGDYVHIPAHRRHRVEWTDRNGRTVWLAFHYTP